MALPNSTLKVPEDSFLVLSLNVNSILKKSKLNESKVWRPLIDAFQVVSPEIKSIFLEPAQNGFNFRAPVHFFLRSSYLEKNPMCFGILASVEDSQKVDTSLANFAESLGFSKKKGKSVRYQKSSLPLEFGRKGKVFHLLGIGPIIRNQISAKEDLNQFFQSISIYDKEKSFPSALSKYFSNPSDISAYVDGSGFAKIVEDNWPEDRWKKLLPLLDSFFNKQLGIHITSKNGSLKFVASDYSVEPKVKQNSDNNLNMVQNLPGDSPIVARLSIPGDELQKTATHALEQILKILSDEKIDKDTILPGFDASPAELLTSPNGDFVLAGGHFKQKNTYQPNGQVLQTLQPSFLLGLGIDQELPLKQLLAGLYSANTFRSLLSSNELHIHEQKKQVWLTNTDYLREIELNKPLKSLNKKRREFLNQYSFALNLDFILANKSIRTHQSLNFSQLKLLNLIDDLDELSIHQENNQVIAHLSLIDRNKSALELIFHHIGQTLIDQANQSIFQAIAQNDLNLVIQSVKRGALVNATDRFGHTPIHYAAYKGNPRIVDYLLSNGGNPNIRGRHESTPLHSAAWGRNIQVLELLLEDGANVDARTDEGETPGMTAALRGEKDMLEILFALSADPHAEDKHGTNMLDLAAAGGHHSIVELLEQIGVKNQNPLHVAAGLGDIKEVKRLLNSGTSIDLRDPFGATPLLVAMVSGKEEVVNFLLSKNANPLLVAKDGYSLLHGAAFSGKKSLVRKALSFNLDVNLRYGPEGITPVDVAEETGDALPYLRSLGGRTAWELGRVLKN